MIRSEMGNGSPVRSVIAAAPKTLLTPSQPMQLSQLRTPGTTMLLPKGNRESGIWAIPVAGPMVDSAPTRTAPTTVPRMIATTPVTKPTWRKSAAARVPMKNAAGTRFGVNQTVKMRETDP